MRHPTILKAQVAYPELPEGFRGVSLRDIIDAYWKNPTEARFDAAIALAGLAMGFARLNRDQMKVMFRKIIVELGGPPA